MTTRPLNTLVPLAIALATTTGIPAHAASSLFIDFEPPTYVTGSIHGQDGWSSSGSAGMGCQPYDHEVAANTFGFPAFGAQSLRISNAYTSGCFGDHTFSRSLPDQAGETLANNASPSGSPVWSSGLRQSRFEAEWSFGSTDTSAEQADLYVVASPDRGDGARMSWVLMGDTPAGLKVDFFDYVDSVPFGTSTAPADGCATEDDFSFTAVASGLSRSETHTIRITMDLFDGPRNDVVQIYVDGTLMHTGTSWEDYFRWCEGLGGPYDQGYGNNESRTVDSILFRTGGGHGFTHPANLGKGFAIDNLSLVSGPVVVNIDLRPGSTTNQVNTSARQLVPIAILSEPGFKPAEDLDYSGVTVRGAEASATKIDIGDLNADGVDDLTLYFRARQMDKPTSTECSDPDAQILLEGSTSLGSSFTGTDYVSWQGPDCGK